MASSGWAWSLRPASLRWVVRMGAPEVNIVDEVLEWQTGTRKEKVSPYFLKTVVVFGPVITDDPIPCGLFWEKTHISDMRYYLDGSNTPSVTIDVRFGSDILSAGTELFAGGLVVNNTIAQAPVWLQATSAEAMDLLWMNVLAKSGTVHSLCVVLRCRQRDD